MHGNMNIKIIPYLLIFLFMNVLVRKTYLFADSGKKFPFCCVNNFGDSRHLPAGFNIRIIPQFLCACKRL
jgi:hypothetical protein